MYGGHENKGSRANGRSVRDDRNRQRMGRRNTGQGRRFTGANTQSHESNTMGGQKTTSTNDYGFFRNRRGKGCKTFRRGDRSVIRASRRASTGSARISLARLTRQRGVCNAGTYSQYDARRAGGIGQQEGKAYRDEMFDYNKQRGGQQVQIAGLTAPGLRKPRARKRQAAAFGSFFGGLLSAGELHLMAFCFGFPARPDAVGLRPRNVAGAIAALSGAAYAKLRRAEFVALYGDAVVVALFAPGFVAVALWLGRPVVRIGRGLGILGAAFQSTFSPGYCCAAGTNHDGRIWLV